MIDNRTVGRTIASLRQAKGMTQQQLAAAMNVSHQAVSKWENGAALPDIQTLLELTQLFGVTVEQLLSGEIPEARMEPDGAQSDPIKDIGNFVSGVFNDIGNMFKSEPKKESAEDDGAEEAEVSGEEEEKPEKNVDIKNLIQMAPFMSKSAVSEMLRDCKQKLTIEEISALAPYIDSACLERLIRESGQEINWDTLRKFAPFLKKEVVDAFARMIALGGKYVRPVSEEVSKTAEDVCKTVEHVSRKIGEGVDKAVRKVVRIGNEVVNEVSKAFEDLAAEPVTREDRLNRLRRSAFEKALEDGKWEWIEAHIGEVTDEDLKQKISERANELGMQDWVSRNLAGYADAATIDTAIANGDWDWLGEHVWKFDGEIQQRVATAAMQEENWQWLSTYAEQLAVDDYIVDIASAARQANENELAVQLIRYAMEERHVSAMTMNALDEGDLEFVDMYTDVLSQDVLRTACMRMIDANNWDVAMHFAEKLDPENVEWLMEIAIQAGNFDAIDALDALLHTEKEGENEE